MPEGSWEEPVSVSLSSPGLVSGVAPARGPAGGGTLLELQGAAIGDSKALHCSVGAVAPVAARWADAQAVACEARCLTLLTSRSRTEFLPLMWARRPPLLQGTPRRPLQWTWRRRLSLLVQCLVCLGWSRPVVLRLGGLSCSSSERACTAAFFAALARSRAWLVDGQAAREWSA